MNNFSSKTISLCPICAKEIPAAIFYKDGVVWMYKNCCGEKWTSLGEVDIQFNETCKKLAPLLSPIFHILIVEITQRCNTP